MAGVRKFRAIIKGFGPGACVEIPFDVEKEFGSRRPKVKATFDGEPYRGTAVRMGTDCHLLLILKSIREKIGKQPGDKVTVTVELDTAERVVEVPVELKKALSKNKVAKTAYEKASYTTRKEIARSIADAKTDATRTRRIEKAIQLLSGTTAAVQGDAPEILLKALNRDRKAKAAYDKMPPSHRKRYAAFILEARQDATRAKRVQDALTQMKEWAESKK